MKDHEPTHTHPFIPRPFARTHAPKRAVGGHMNEYCVEKVPEWLQTWKIVCGEGVGEGETGEGCTAKFETPN